MSPPRALLAWLSKRALSVSVVLLVVAVAALIAWLARGRSPVTMSVSASTHAPPTNVWSGGEKPASTLPIATSASGALSPARDPVLVEVCGLGWADVPADASWPDPRLFAQVPGVEASLT